MLCKCELEAKRIQVKKEGPNKDRYFFACPQERAKQCDFFEWETREPVHKAPVTQEMTQGQHQEVMGALRRLWQKLEIIQGILEKKDILKEEEFELPFND